MPLFTGEQMNLALNALDIGWMSLHNAFSSVGVNELGSANYLRQQVLFNPAASAQRLLAAPASFALADLDVVAWIGLWSSDNATFVGMSPAQGSALQAFAMGDTQGGAITAPNHGFQINSSVVFWGGSGSALPPPITEGPIYYVVQSAVDFFTVSTDPAGTPLTYSATGCGFLQGIAQYLSFGANTYTVPSFALDGTAIY